MAKYRNISGGDVRGPFIPGEYAEAGEVVELPDEQTDGSPLIHHPDIWEPVDKKAKQSAKAAATEGDAA